MFQSETFNILDLMKKKASILIVDDDDDVLFTARAVLRKEYQTVETLTNPERIPKIIQELEPDLVLLDMNFKPGATAGKEGLFWLRKIMEIKPDSHVIMNTAYGDIPLAVECMKEGAIDFLIKPWEKERLISTVNAAYQLLKSKKEIEKLKNTETILSNDLATGYTNIISKARSMETVLSTIDKVAETDANVLILGENGTGKELIAREIHRKSNRTDKPFIKVDLGSISSTLFESELFGHTKGAFTDARTDQAGRFEVADRGTLFLDEIGNLEMALQAKLLTSLQNREITKVGSSKPISVDVRIISATNSPIETLAKNGDFRMDLLYRINTVIIQIPPLRNRKADIEPMLEHFLRVYSEKYKKKHLTIETETIDALKAYAWPGNVRELQNAVERAVIMCDVDKIKTTDFLIQNSTSTPLNSTILNVEDAEKVTIQNALIETGGKLADAAKLLGIGRTTLYRKLKKLNIDQ